MNKKAQITIFIIVGVIIIIAAIVLMLLTKTDFNLDDIDTRTEITPLETHVKDCIKQVIEPGVNVLASQGGYIFYWNDTVKTKYSNLTYGFKEDSNNLPSEGFIQAELETYMNLALVDCVDFSLFPEFSVEAGEPKVSITINMESIVIDVDYPIKATKKNTTYELNEFKHEADIRLGHVYSIANDIIAKVQKDPEWVDMSYLGSFDIDVKILPHDENTLVYALEDNSAINNPLVFMFASYYVPNKAPTFDLPDTIEWDDGKYFVMLVEASDPEDDPLTFSDDTALFDIDEKGIIKFAPEIPGEYDVTITVEDDHMNKVEDKIRFIIRGD